MENNVVISKLRGAKISAHKMTLVARFAKGKKAEDLIRYLPFDPRKGAGLVYSAIKSAMSNAENNNKMNKSDLYVKEIKVGPAETLKRARFGAKGRSSQILKRRSNMEVVVGLSDKEVCEKEKTK